MNFQRLCFFTFTVAQLIPRCAKMDVIQKISRVDYKISKGCNFLLEGDNIVGPTNSNLFLLRKTFSLLSESDFYSPTALLAFFFLISKHISFLSAFFKLHAILNI